MLQLFIAFFMAFACPNHTATTHNNGSQVSAMDDTGGETGHIPPKPPTTPPNQP